MTRVAAAVLALAVAGCLGGGKMPATRYYQLSPRAAAGAGASGGGAVLVIEPFATDQAYDDERIVYRANPYRLDYYDYHRWSASPGVLIAGYLESALEASGRFRAVVREPSPEAGAVLGGRVAAIEEVDESPRRWTGRVVIELRLTDAKSGEVLWSEQFEEREPLREQSPEGLARALSVAMGRVVERAAPAIEGRLVARGASTDCCTALDRER